MNLNQKSWNEQEHEIAVSLWKSGASASKIGQELGRTRNSVMGYIHRLKLNMPDRILKKEPKPIRPRTPKVAKPRMPSIKNVKFVGPTYSSEPSHRVSLLDLGAFMCKWVKDDRLLGHLPEYCGLPVLDGKSWCGFHHGITTIERTSREKQGVRQSSGTTRAGAEYRSHQT